MTFADRLSLLFMKDLLATPRGRAHLLSQCADAESSGEGRVFEELLKREDDRELKRLVSRHQEDEVRHAELLGIRCEAQGVGHPAVPEHLKMINRLDEALGGFFSQKLESHEDVMRAYLVLQVIEERAITQFGLFEQAVRPYDPQTAAVFQEISRDEERHLKYCHAVAKKFAPSPEVHAKTLKEFRDVEAKVFARNTNANLDYVLGHGLLQISAPKKWAWKAVRALAGALDLGRPTPFHGAQLPAGNLSLATA